MANQVFDNDGQTRVVTREDLVVGNVIRMVNADGTSNPFSDCLIVKINILSMQFGEDMTTVDLARAYAYVGFDAYATSPSVLIAYEAFSVRASSLISENSRFHVCMLSTGHPHNRRT